MKLWFGIALLLVLIMPGKAKASVIQDNPGSCFNKSLYPPINLMVDPQSLEATWLAPGAAFNQLEETWHSLDFETNGWTFEPSPGNWMIDSTFGNPEPSARFEWTPGLSNYSHAVVSRELNGIIMPNVLLKYDYNLDNYSSSTLEQLAVEVWNGSAWVEVALYSNASGNIPWTTHTLDISSLVSGQMFKVRFRVFGVNSWSIDWWSVDNIKVYADVNGNDSEELLGYYVYLNEAVVTFTEETSFSYNPWNFNYGQSYTASVRAAYDAGLSAADIFVFTSEHLFKPCNLEGSDINHAVALSWEAPGTCEPGGAAVPTSGYKIYRDNNLVATLGDGVFNYIDEPLVAGLYDYTITALYPYDNALVESLPDGPVSIRVEPGAGFVVGTVTDAITSDSIAGVIVNAGIYTTYTLDDGSYWLVAPEGTYDLVYNKIGYALYIIEDFEIVWLQTHEVDVELTTSEPNIPFFEDWDSEDFDTNGWTFETGQGNWQINTDQGNPAPAAEFVYNPTVTDYSFSLVSQEIDARGIYEGLMLTFDLSLNSYAHTNTEKLRLDIWNGTEWVEAGQFMNANNMPWTRQSFDISALAANRFTRVRFVAHGQNSFNIENWRIDNIQVDLAPAISCSPTFMFQFMMPYGGIAYQPLIINNEGLGTLNYNITVHLGDSVPDGEYAASAEMELSPDPDPTPGGEPATIVQDEEVILNYDGPNFDAIGLTAGGTFYVAARFPSSMVGQYIGYCFESVDVYTNDLPLNMVLKIWGAGTSTTPGPLLYEQTYNPSAQSWNTISLSENVMLDGSDVWVGYSVTNAAGLYPAGVDAGPANPNGDWISLDGIAWEHLAGYGLNHNFNIRAKIINYGPLWLSVDPTQGTVHPGESDVVTVIFDMTELTGYYYTAHLKIFSNDPETPLLVVPVALEYVIQAGNIANGSWAVCYPVPASDILYLEFKPEITEFRIFNPTGQAVLSRKTESKEIFIVDVSRLPNGLYYLQADAKNGRIYSRKILISR